MCVCDEKDGIKGKKKDKFIIKARFSIKDSVEPIRKCADKKIALSPVYWLFLSCYRVATLLISGPLPRRNASLEGIMKASKARECFSGLN